MDIEDLRLIVDVAHAGNFAAVARRRDLDPSAVSRAISRIEADLGVRLFHRTTRSLALTEAGQRFAARTEALLEDFDVARTEAQEATETASGTVRITASVGFGQMCIVPLLAELRRRHDGLRIELLATDANLDLAAEGIDLAVRLASRPEGDYVVTKLRDTRYRVVGSPAFAARSPFSRPADLIGAPCLCFPLPGFRTSWKFRDAAGQIEEVPVSGPIQASTSIALRELAQDGLGATLLADWLIDRDIDAGTLVDLFPDHEVTATQFDSAAWLLYPSRRFVPAKTRAVVAFLKEKLGAAAIR